MKQLHNYCKNTLHFNCAKLLNSLRNEFINGLITPNLKQISKLGMAKIVYVIITHFVHYES